jgi:hypothetical protein
MTKATKREDETRGEKDEFFLPSEKKKSFSV